MAGDPDTASVRFHHFLYNSQPQPGTFLSSGGGYAGFAEFLENQGNFIFGDSQPLIPYKDFQRLIGTAGSECASGLRKGEFESIGNQVVQHWVDPIRIQINLGERFRECKIELDGLCSSQRQIGRMTLLEIVPQVDPLLLQLQMAGLNGADIQQIRT